MYTNFMADIKVYLSLQKFNAQDMSYNFQSIFSSSVRSLSKRQCLATKRLKCKGYHYSDQLLLGLSIIMSVENLIKSWEKSLLWEVFCTCVSGSYISEIIPAVSVSFGLPSSPMS